MNIRGLIRAMQGAALLVSVALIGACVTTTDSRFANADKTKAVAQYTELGMRYIQQGDTAEAKRPLKRAFEIDPRSPEVHNAFAFLYQAESEPALAEEHFQKALQYDENATWVRNNYAAFLYGQSNYARACEQLEITSLDTLYENRSGVYENLGTCRLAMADSQKALRAFDKALEINPNSSKATLEAAILHLEDGNVKVSQALYDRFQRSIRLRSTQNSSKSLWLGVRLARISGDKNKEASYSLMLRNMFPESEETKTLKSSSS